MRIGHWDITFVFSLICSLLINSGMVGVVVLRAQGSNFSETKQLKTKTPPPRPAPEIAPPAPQKPLEFDNREVFGEHDATGQALNSSPGDQPMLAAAGDQTQSFLGRNPSAAQGANGGGGQVMIGAPSPQQAAVPRFKAAPPPLKSPQVKAPPLNAPAPKTPPKQQPDKQVQTPEVATGNQPLPKPPSPPATPAPSPQNPPTPQIAAAPPTQAPPPPQEATAASVAVAQPPPGAPGPRTPAADDPAPPSNEDSDPFSDTNSFHFVNGKVQARNGRQVHPVKPRFLEISDLEAALTARPSVTFLATVDEKGNVIRVELYRSSGSDSIDLPCKNALYQWWIEPSKDRGGKPVQDVVSITFVLYD